MQTYWHTNIRHLRMRKKLSQEELSFRLGITRAKLAAHEGGKTKNPPLEELLRFSTFFKLSIDTLVKVNLTKLSELKLRALEAGNDSYTTGTQIRILATTVDNQNNENVELVPLKARAGYTAGYGDPEFISQLPVFTLPHLPRGRKYRMFPVSGDSMLPVPDGAFIISEYCEDWQSLKAGTACVVITRNEGIVFKLVTSHIKETRTLLLVSMNPSYKPYEVPVEDVLEIWQFRSLVTDKLPEPESELSAISRQLQELKAAMMKNG